MRRVGCLWLSVTRSRVEFVRWLAGAISLSLVAALSLPAQRPDSLIVFRGRIVEQGSRAPVVGADVWLALSDRHARTDSTGAFRFDSVAAGIQLVEIRRLGFDVRRDTLRLSPARETVRTYSLASAVARLDTVHSVSPQTKYISPMLRSFEERRLSGQGGHFVSDSEFRKNENTTLANILGPRIPGISVVQGKVLVSSRKSCKGQALAGCSSPNCYVTIYLDGALYYSPAPPLTRNANVPPPDLSRDIDPTSLAGAEYYADGASAPIGMHSNDQGCGTLWLWTRER